MARLCIVLVALLMTIAGFLSAQVPAGEEPVRVITDYEAPPVTFYTAWARAAAIVRVRIEQSQPVHRGMAPLTEHTVSVLEVFKSDDIALGQQVRVFQDSVDDAVPGPKHTSGGPVFAPGEEYVLFLERASLGGTLHIAWGPSGALSMASNPVSVKGAMRMWSGLPEVPRARVLDTLRLMRVTGSGR